MSGKLKALQRIEAVQAEMTRLAEWRLAAAEGALRAAADDRTRLDAFIGADQPVGGPLARAALGTMKSLDRRLAAAEAERARQRAQLEALQRRAHAVEDAVGRGAAAARREADGRETRDVLEAWLAAQAP